MFIDDNQTTAPDFSDIPSLDDVQGLETYLNNQALAAQGLQPAETPAASTETPAQPAQPAQPAAPAAGAGAETITLTKEQLTALLAGRGQAPQPQANPQPQQPQQPQAPGQGNAGYTAQEQQFIANALAKGYSLTQINDFLTRQKAGQGVDAATAQRISAIENYLRTQEYKAAETAFVNRLTEFGNKWGLSEQDLVAFGNAALKQGINIAVGDVNLDTVFRAVFPEQYAIRSQRMTPTTSSQIYGGTSIPESNKAAAARAEDQYVEAFLKGAMPNQYAALNKK